MLASLHFESTIGQAILFQVVHRPRRKIEVIFSRNILHFLHFPILNPRASCSSHAGSTKIPFQRFSQRRKG